MKIEMYSRIKKITLINIGLFVGVTALNVTMIKSSGISYGCIVRDFFGKVATEFSEFKEDGSTDYMHAPVPVIKTVQMVKEAEEAPAVAEIAEKAASFVPAEGSVLYKEYESEEFRARYPEYVIYINSEESETLLAKLPGIGPKRIPKFKEYRPYRNVSDVMASRVGVGSYWARKWEEMVKAGKIVFD
ncbi:MAG: hypothetical protein JXJ19_07135 [Elusimicrobia bacterium]|nr:hypothetical protein [Elusimicrobiota bacterium]